MKIAAKCVFSPFTTGCRTHMTNNFTSTIANNFWLTWHAQHTVARYLLT